MAFIRSELMHQQILDAEADINEFLRSNDIDDSFMIQAFELSKEVFADESEAIEYIESRGYFSEDVEVTEDKFIFNVREVGQFKSDLLRIETRRGVEILVGELRPVEIFTDSEIQFSETATEWSIKPIDIKNFSSKSPLVIEVAKVVDGHHPRYGDVSITEDDLKSMERNFKEKVTGVDLSINKDHEKVEALGWFKDLFLSFDGKTLLAEVSWCPKGVSVLKDKSFRYFSPEFSFNYEHPHNGTKHGATLTGGALTNYPFLKMDAITELNNKTINGGIKVNTIDLKVHEDKMLDLNSKITTLESDAEKAKTTIEGLTSSNVELSEKITKMDEAKALEEKEAKHEKLFSDGKINKTQLDMLKEGKTFEDIMEFNGKLHVEADGSDNDGKTEDVSEKLTEDERAFCLKFGTSEEDYIKYNK